MVSEGLAVESMSFGRNHLPLAKSCEMVSGPMLFYCGIPMLMFNAIVHVSRIRQ